MKKMGIGDAGILYAVAYSMAKYGNELPEGMAMALYKTMVKYVKTLPKEIIIMALYITMAKYGNKESICIICSHTLHGKIWGIFLGNNYCLV